jgi:hypothetical protein
MRREVSSQNTNCSNEDCYMPSSKTERYMKMQHDKVIYTRKCVQENARTPTPSTWPMQQVCLSVCVDTIICSSLSRVDPQHRWFRPVRVESLIPFHVNFVSHVPDWYLSSSLTAPATAPVLSRRCMLRIPSRTSRLSTRLSLVHVLLRSLISWIETPTRCRILLGHIWHSLILHCRLKLWIARAMAKWCWRAMRLLEVSRLLISVSCVAMLRRLLRLWRRPHLVLLRCESSIGVGIVTDTG